MRKFRAFYYLACLSACGPETAISESDPSTGTASSSGESTITPTTSATDPGSTTATTGDTDASSTSDTTGDVCLAFETEDNDDFEAMSRTCGLAELCAGPGPLVFTTDDDETWSTDDTDRARCMAEAMRDRTPGWFHYVHYEGLTEFRSVREILGEQVIVRQIDAGDFSGEFSERVTFLQSGKVFALCAAGTATDIHTCLSEGFLDVCATTLECPN